MKTRYVQSIILIFIIAGFFACEADDGKTITKRDLPDLTRSFIEFNLSEYKILNIKDLKPSGDELEKYEVTFSNNLVIVFNILGYWWKIDSQEELPEKLQNLLVTDEIAAFKESYPEAVMTGLYNVDYGKKIKLSDGTMLAVYTDYNSVVVGEDLTRVPEMLPDKINLFMDTYYYGLDPKYAIHANINGKEMYKICSSMKADKSLFYFYFDKDGNWHSVECSRHAVPNELYQTLPQAVREYMEKEYKNASVYGIARYDTYYQLNLANNKYVLVDSEQGESIIPTDVVLHFIKTHFSEDNNLSMNITMDREPDFISYHFAIHVDGFEIDMHTDVNGVWHTLTVLGKPIPQSIFDTLPLGIKTYIAQLPDARVSGIKKEAGKYLVRVGNVTFLFDSEGNKI